jgi:hypothetical protein
MHTFKPNASSFASTSLFPLFHTSNSIVRKQPIGWSVCFALPPLADNQQCVDADVA